MATGGADIEAKELREWQRRRATSAIETQLAFMESEAGRDRFSRDARIALYGKMTMAADLGAIGHERWAGYYDRLRRLTMQEEGGG